ncbi:E3 ubiquitin-protein ligase TRIM39-like isoform X1 [Lissotriton helveticus]
MAGKKRKSAEPSEGSPRKKWARNKTEAKQLQNLRHEATCSICLEFFKDPVSIDCGHNFCQACITRCWEDYERNFPCPQCRAKSQARNLRPNRQLANIAEITSQLHIPKDKLQSSLAALKLEVETILGFKSKEEKEVVELEEKFKSQRERVTTEFEELLRFLREEKRRLLVKLKKEQDEILKKIRGKVLQLEEQHSSLRKLITEIEGKRHRPDAELLKDAQATLSRCEAVKVQRPEAESPEREKILRTFCTQHTELQRMVDIYKETFPIELEWRRARSYAATVTLDPNTAHLSLILAEGRKSVRSGARKQKLPDKPERFTHHPFVLGKEGFSTGKHYFEVEVGEKQSWIVGMCHESVPRKSRSDLIPENGFWGLTLHGTSYAALATPMSTFTPRVIPRTLAVFLDYEAGKIIFYNMEDKTQIYAYLPCIFTRTLRPFLCPDRDGAKNTGALRIRPVIGWD